MKFLLRFARHHHCCRKGTTLTTGTSQDDTAEKGMKLCATKCKVMLKRNKSNYYCTKLRTCLLETKQVEDLGVLTSHYTGRCHQYSAVRNPRCNLRLFRNRQ